MNSVDATSEEDFELQIQSLVINVKSASVRMAFQEKQLSMMGIAWERIPAVTIDDTQVTNNSAYWDGWQRPLAPAERACLCSHMVCWKMVFNNNTPYLILEDDALLADDLAEVLKAATQINNFDLLQLETRNRAKLLGTKVFNFGPAKMRTLLVDRAGAAGYILWPTGAKKLLNHAAKRPGLADSILAKPGLLRAAQILPARVIQNDMAQLFGVAPELPPEASSVSSACHRRARKSLSQTLRRIMTQLCLGILQCQPGQKIMVPFGKKTRITTKTSYDDDASL